MTNKGGSANFYDCFQLNDLKQDDMAIRQAWQTGTPLGNNRFKEKVEKVLKTKVGFALRGRPKKLEEKVVRKNQSGKGL